MRSVTSRNRNHAPRHPTRGLKGSRPGDGVARYYELYELLSGALNDGTILPGDALPSEPELVARHRLSRTTVRRALARLEEEGRIERRRGSGTFARESHEPTKLCLNLDCLHNDLLALAARTSVALLRFETQSVPAAITELQPQVGARALVIQRVRLFRGAPFQLSTAYVPENVGKLIRKRMLRHASLLSVLDEVGPKTTSAEHITGAVAADATAAKRLDVSLGTPLLRMRIAFRDRKASLRAFCESYFRPDRFHIRAAMERTTARRAKEPWRFRGS